jgi:hypothetical protein
LNGAPGLVSVEGRNDVTFETSAATLERNAVPEGKKLWFFREAAALATLASSSGCFATGNRAKGLQPAEGLARYRQHLLYRHSERSCQREG